MKLWYNNRVSDYMRRPRSERSEQTVARTCATLRSDIMAGGHGIIIALAIIRAGRAVSEANKPLRGPSVNINRFLVILYRRYLYGV